MKKSTIAVLTLLLVGSVLLNSCKKYQYGPMFSLKSKTERVANTWTIASAVDSTGQDMSNNFQNFELFMSKEGTAQLSFVIDVLGTPFTISTNGTWEFINNNTQIRFDYDMDDFDGVVTILKLMEDELWFEDEDKSEFHLIPKV